MVCRVDLRDLPPNPSWYEREIAFKKMFTAFKKAVAAKNYMPAIINLGNLYYQKGDWAQALQQYGLLCRPFVQSDQRVTDQVGGGFVPGVEDEHAVLQQLHLA